MWERAVHDFFQSVDSAQSLSMRRLDCEGRETLNFGPSTSGFLCGPDHHFEAMLLDGVKDAQPCYLYPASRNFAGLDSVALLVPQTRIRKRQLKFYTFQMTIAASHPVKISGLQTVQSWFKKDTILEDYRPTLFFTCS
jgi:hypothetical protein